MAGKILAVLAMFTAVCASAQKLPLPRLHLPAPSAGTTAAASGQVPAGNLPSLKLAARIDPVKIYAAESFYYLIALDWSKSSAACELEFKLPEAPKAPGVKVIGSEFESATSLKAETETVTRIYKFKYFPEKSGKTSIPQADFEYRCRGTEAYAQVSAPPFPVEVMPKRFHLTDLKGNRSFQAVLASVLALAIGSSVFMFLRDRKRKAAPKPAELVKSPEDKALELLTSADQYRIAGRYPDYFLGLERALKLALEEKYSMRWSGKDKMRDEIGRATAPELGEGIEQFLVLSDRVKFAGLEPKSAELDRCYQAVRRVIEYQKLEIAGGGK